MGAVGSVERARAALGALCIGLAAMMVSACTGMAGDHDDDTELDDPEGGDRGAQGAGNLAEQRLALADLWANAPPPPPKTLPVKEGIWLSRAEALALPVQGAAWDALRAAASEPMGKPALRNQNDDTNVLVLARALVFVRTGDQTYRSQVLQTCRAAIGTERNGRVLAVGREAAAYAIAAELVGLTDASDPTLEQDFRAWLKQLLDADLDGSTIQYIHSTRPNNWGTDAGAARAAIAAYLGDEVELARTAQVFKGWLGDTATYPGAVNAAKELGFRYGTDTSWQADPNQPLGVNRVGALSASGESLDGALPDDMRRGGPIAFPPKYTNYPWGALQGATVIAEILSRRGYDAWSWQDRAVLRATAFLQGLSTRFSSEWWAHDDDEWIPYVINRRYGTAFPAGDPKRFGKNMGWTAWTHGTAP
jgi:hypothetical protein